MGSYDGTNFFEVASSTDAWTVPTTTIDSDPRAIQFDPGTATSTVSFPFYTYGHKYTRFIIWSEGWTGDLDVGVQAWIRAIPFNK
jgi:hypothetical protein